MTFSLTTLPSKSPPCLAPRTEFSVQNAQETSTVKFCPPYHHSWLRVYAGRSHHFYLVSSHVCLDVKFVLYWALFGGIISSSVWRITGHNLVSCFTCRYWIFCWTISSLFPFRLCHLQSHLKPRRHCLTVMLFNRSCSVVQPFLASLTLLEAASFFMSFGLFMLTSGVSDSPKFLVEPVSYWKTLFSELSIFFLASVLSIWNSHCCVTPGRPCVWLCSDHKPQLSARKWVDFQLLSFSICPLFCPKTPNANHRGVLVSL